MNAIPDTAFWCYCQQDVAEIYFSSDGDDN